MLGERTARRPAALRRITAVVGLASTMLLASLGLSLAGDVPIATVVVGTSPNAIAVDPVTHQVFVANFYSDSVSVIDGVSDTVTATVPMPKLSAIGAAANAVVVDPVAGRAFVANWQSDCVSVIAQPTMTVVSTVEVPAAKGGAPRALALDVANSKLYVADYGTNQVSVIDAGTGALTNDIAVGSSPRALGLFSSITRRRVFVANRYSDNVSVIDGETELVIATLAAGSAPKAIAVDPSTGFAYVTNAGSNNVTVIDDSDQVTATIPVGGNPLGIAVDSAGGRVFVANYLTNNVSVISTATNSVIATVAVGVNPWSVAYDSGDAKAFVSCYGSKETYVISSLLATTAVACDYRPHALAIDEAASPHKAYVSNWGSGTVTVIDEPGPSPVAALLAPAKAVAAPPGPVSVSIDALPGGTTTSATPTLVGGASSRRGEYPSAMTAVFWRLDGDARWERAVITSGAGTSDVRWGAAVETSLAPGSHTVHVAALDQAGAVSYSAGQDGGGAGASLSDPTAYAFSYVDASSDTTPPVTSVSGVPGGWSSTDVTVTLTATDTGGSGVASTWYSLDGGAPQLYTLPFGVTAEGTTTVACWSIDGAANTETSHSVDVRIDKTPPMTTSDAAASYVGTASIQLTAIDARSGVAGIAYSLDGGAWTTATTVVTTGTGGHTLQYRSVDAAGNLESPGSVAFTIVAGSVADVPTGTDVVVTTPEGVTFEFDEVTSAGTVTVAHTGSGPQLPGNFRLARGAYYDISVSASFSGFVTITLPYDENAIVGKEKNLKLFHRTSAGRWEDITVSVDTAANTITGRTSSFSPFGVGYSPWEPTSTANIGSLPTPHKGYTVSTNKCAVCHSAHKSEPTGEVLLGVPAADACSFCHIETGIGIRRIYDATTTAYAIDSSVTAFGGGFAHTKDSVICQDCHSVHGARTLDGGNIAKILKDWTYWRDAPGGFTDYSTLALAKWSNPATVAVKYDQQSAWCTGCHKYFTESYDTSAAAVQYFDGTGWAFAGSHVMTSAPKAYGNPHRTMEGTVAFAPSATCRTCHNAGAVDTTGGTVTNSFPHYTPDFYRFMGVGASVAETASANTTGTVDGLCLKCHRDGTGEGVGLGF